MSAFFPCEWPVVYPSGCTAYEADESGMPDSSIFEQAAIGMLWNWTQRVFGTCRDTIRPCKVPKPLVPPASSFEGTGPWPINPGFGSGHSTIGWWGVGAWMPVLVAGNWYNVVCGSCATTGNPMPGIPGYCTCEPNRMTVLGLPGPIVSVDEVLIEDVPLDPSAYWVRNRRWLTRSDGESWALPQDLTQENGPKTWSITYTHGVEVPPGGALAAGTLACELAKAWVGDNTCALPQRMQTVSREGITIELPSPNSIQAATRAMTEIPKSNTGIWTIDSWVDSVNVPRYSVGVRSVDGANSERWHY